MANELVFFFEGGPVGTFTESFPRNDGLYRYEPFRCASHYLLMNALRTSSGHRCYYDEEGLRFFFTVKSHPSYGMLDLIEFDTPKPLENQSGQRTKCG